MRQIKVIYKVNHFSGCQSVNSRRWRQQQLHTRTASRKRRLSRNKMIFPLLNPSFKLDFPARHSELAGGPDNDAWILLCLHKKGFRWERVVSSWVILINGTSFWWFDSLVIISVWNLSPQPPFMCVFREISSLLLNGPDAGKRKFNELQRYAQMRNVCALEKSEAENFAENILWQRE